MSPPPFLPEGRRELNMIAKVNKKNRGSSFCQKKGTLSSGAGNHSHGSHLPE